MQALAFKSFDFSLGQQHNSKFSPGPQALCVVGHMLVGTKSQRTSKGELMAVGHRMWQHWRTPKVGRAASLGKVRGWSVTMQCAGLQLVGKT